MPVALNYPPSYALQTWHDYRNFGLLPEAGGINDQCPLWYADMHALNRRYAYLLYQHREQGDDDDFAAGVNGPDLDWETVFRREHGE